MFDTSHFLFFVNVASQSRAHAHIHIHLYHACITNSVLKFLCVTIQFYTRKSHLNLLFLDFSLLSNCECVFYTVKLYTHTPFYACIRFFLLFEQCIYTFGICTRKIFSISILQDLRDDVIMSNLAKLPNHILCTKVNE